MDQEVGDMHGLAAWSGTAMGGAHFIRTPAVETALAEETVKFHATSTASAFSTSSALINSPNWPPGNVW